MAEPVDELLDVSEVYASYVTVGFTHDVYTHAIPDLEAEAADKIAGLIFGAEARKAPRSSPCLPNICSIPCWKGAPRGSHIGLLPRT